MGKNRTLLLIIAAFLLLALPLTVYLAATKQFIFKQASFGEVTVNFVPTSIVKNVNEEFAVDVYLNSGTVPVSAISLKSFTAPSSNLTLVRVEPEAGANKPFTDSFVQNSQAVLPITLVSQKTTENLPKNSFKAATLVFKGTSQISGTITLNQFDLEIVGYNQNNEDVVFNPVSGTATTFNINGNLCKVANCPTITLTEQARTDGKYNIKVDWASTGANYIYRVFRNKDNPLTDNIDNNFIASVSVNTFTDTNNNSGFNGNEKYYYNVDVYQTCQ